MFIKIHKILKEEMFVYKDTLSYDHHFRSNKPVENMGLGFGSHHWDKALTKLPTFDF